MEETINIKEVLQILKKRMNFIITIILGALLISAFITFFVITPQYQASTQILVNQSQNENNTVSSSELQSSRDLISTYNVIITSPTILEPVIENTDFEGSVEDLRSKIEVSSEEESQVATVSIKDSNPQLASALTNNLAQTFENEIPNIMDVDNVSVLSEAQLANDGNPVSPQPILILTVASVIGLVIGAGIAFLLEFLDKSIKNEQDIEKELGLPILGVVPTMRENELDKSSNLTSSNKSMRSKNKEERKTS